MGRRVEPLPRTPRVCALPMPCVYRESGVCDDPRNNKGNSDAACHRMVKWKINEALTAPAPKTNEEERI